MKWTRERFEGLRANGRLTPIAEIAGTTRTAAVVSRAILKAFRQAWVEVREVDAPRPIRVPHLEEELLRRWPAIRVAIVVKGPSAGKTSIDDPLNDHLHRDLGIALAEVLGVGVFRDGDVIGLGSGRGVLQTVTALSKRLPPPLETVTLVSLTGAIHQQERQTKLLVDADTHVALLGPGLARNFRPQYMSQPLAFFADGLERALARSPLAPKAWKENLPTHAILGVGVLAEGHRLFDEDQASVIKNPMLDPVRDPLKKLVELCTKVTTPDYCPIGDITNRFFFVPPRQTEVSADHERRIQESLEEFNSRLLTVTTAQLREVKTIILVAGGRRKAMAIHHLLAKEELNIRYLCTDEETAKTLIDSTSGPKSP